MEYQEQISHTSKRFDRLARELKKKRVLSLGGGVDRLAVLLAADGSQVLSLDLSPIAVRATAGLARQAGVAQRLTALTGTAEEARLASESFDLVICKRALHHMEIDQILSRIHTLLARDGIFLALEPFCLLRRLRWVHARFPFHPYGMTDDERELTGEDLTRIRQIFREVDVSYHDSMSRESIAILLCRARLGLLAQGAGQAGLPLAEPRPPLAAVVRHLADCSSSEVANPGRDRGRVTRGMPSVDVTSPGHRSTDAARPAEELEKHRQSISEYENRVRAIMKTCRTHNIKPIFMTQPALYGKGVGPVTGVNLETVALTAGNNGHMRWTILEAVQRSRSWRRVLVSSPSREYRPCLKPPFLFLVTLKLSQFDRPPAHKLQLA